MSPVDPIRAVSVITTGDNGLHHEHVYGTREPELVWMSEVGVDTNPDLDRWRGLLRVGGWSAVGSVALIVVQVVVFAVWPPPETVPEIFELMLRSPVLGLVSMDLLLLVNNLLVVLIYLALAVVLWAVSRSAVVLVLALGFVQMAA